MADTAEAGPQDATLRRRIWGWMMFDWASQPYWTLLLTFIFGPYFVSVAAEGYMGDGVEEQQAKAFAQSLWSRGQAVVGLFIAITAPFLGAVADTTGRRMPWITGFSVLILIGASGTWLLLPDGTFLTGALILFLIGVVGAEYATTFTNAMLPSLGPQKAIGEISGNGFAIGYVGGIVALAIALLLLVETDSGRTLAGLKPVFGLDPEMREGTRAAGPFVALWYVVFMLFFYAWVREPRMPSVPGAFRKSLKQLGASLRAVPRNTSLFAYLGSSMFYRDALFAMYAFGGNYARLVLDWSIVQIGIFGIVGALAAAFFAWVGGRADRHFGPKPVITACIVLLTICATALVTIARDSVLGIALPEGSNLPDIMFYIVGATTGGAGGVLQSASRTMMVRHADPNRPTEGFGLYAFTGKATAWMASGLIGVVTLAAGSARFGYIPIIFLFLIGLILLLWVKPQGERAEAG